MSNDGVLKKDTTEPEEKRESVRGKLKYYQELILQIEKTKKKEEELKI